MMTIIVRAVLTIFTSQTFVIHFNFPSQFRFSFLKLLIIIVGSCCWRFCCLQSRMSEIVFGLFVGNGWCRCRWPFSLVDGQDRYEVLRCIVVCLSVCPRAVVIRISFAVASVAAAATFFGKRKKKEKQLKCLHWYDRGKEKTTILIFFFLLWRNSKFCPTNFLNAFSDLIGFLFFVFRWKEENKPTEERSDIFPYYFQKKNEIKTWEKLRALSSCCFIYKKAFKITFWFHCQKVFLFFSFSTLEYFWP